MEKSSNDKRFPGYYIHLYNQIYEKKISQEEYVNELFNLSYKSSDQQYYITSYYYFEKKEISKAKEAIENAMQIIQSKDTGEDGLFHSLFDKVPIHKVYDCAGQIYADLGEMAKSQECYNKGAYHMIQLKSEFEGGGIVYSFRSVNIYSLSDLITGSITVLHPKKMNDPFDSLFMLWASEDNLNASCRNKEHITPFCNSFQYFKIRSFIANKNLTSDNNIVRKVKMWSHYADDHKGYCVKYKLSDDFIKKGRNGDYTHLYLKRIKYQSKGKAIDLVSGKMDTTKLLATKSHEWKPENEIRLIYYDSSCKEDFKQLSLNEGAEIEAIYFGYKCSDSNICNIMKIVGKTVQYYKMDHNLSNIYKLNAVKIRNE